MGDEPNPVLVRRDELVQRGQLIRAQLEVAMNTHDAIQTAELTTQLRQNLDDMMQWLSQHASVMPPPNPLLQRAEQEDDAVDGH